MTILLKKVELKNIRSHKSVVFTPEQKGVTALSGPNGSGKSTIVDSIAWALYGAKPQGVSKNIDIVRKGVEAGKEEAWAKIYLKVNGEDLLVERRVVSKGGAIECELYSLEGDDKILLAGPAVSHSEPIIRKKIGMNLQGFLSAILVQQKQVDHLILSTPKERTKVIERLTGVDSITHAYQQARNEYNSLKKLLGQAPEIEKIEELEKELEKLDKEIARTSQLEEKEKNTLLEASDKLQSLQDTLEEQRKLSEKKHAIDRELSRSEFEMESIEASLIEVTKEKDSVKKQIVSLAGEDLDTVSKNLRNAENKLSRDRGELLVLQNSIKEQESRRKELEEIIVKSKAPSKEVAESNLKDSRKKLEKAREELERAVKTSAAADSTIKQLSNAIEVLKEGECPTCLQKVTDIAAAVQELKTKISSVPIEDVSAKKAVVKKLESKCNALEVVVESFKELDGSKDDLLKDNDKVSSLASSVKVLELEVDTLKKRHYQARQDSDKKQSYDRLKKKAQSLVRRKQSLTKNISDKRKVLSELKVMPDKSYNKLVNDVDNLREKVSLSKVANANLAGEKKFLLEKKDNLDRRARESKSAREKYDNLLRSVEIAANSSQLLEEFRVDRVNSSIPLLESYASDLLNRFTEGRFTGVKLDAKFNARIVRSDGTSLPIGLLSGGELSAAAIALRIAISMLLNVESGENSIILDEVLVSQDRDRAEIVLNTIAEVCKGQVIIIAHNDSIDSVADKVVTLG